MYFSSTFSTLCFLLFLLFCFVSFRRTRLNVFVTYNKTLHLLLNAVCCYYLISKRQAFLACVAGHRKGGKSKWAREGEGPLLRSSRVRSSRASRVRLFPFPPLRTPATQARPFRRGYTRLQGHPVVVSSYPRPVKIKRVKTHLYGAILNLFTKYGHEAWNILLQFEINSLLRCVLVFLVTVLGCHLDGSRSPLKLTFYSVLVQFPDRGLWLDLWNRRYDSALGDKTLANTRISFFLFLESLWQGKKSWAERDFFNNVFINSDISARPQLKEIWLFKLQDINVLEKTELRNADHTVGVNCYTCIFSNISSGTAWLLQGMFTTEFKQPR